LIDIPDFDEVITGCGGEDVLGGRVEDDLSDFPFQVRLGLIKESAVAYLPPAFSFPSGLRSSATHPSSPHPSNKESWIFQIQTAPSA
jgi:hypothetical protein